MIDNIKFGIDENFVKKAIGSKENMIEYIQLLFQEKGISAPSPKTIREMTDLIINTWDYEVSKKIMRELFRKTEKYKIAKNSDFLLNEMIKEWNELKLGSIEWPYAAAAFDSYMQRINHSHLTNEKKDEQVMIDAVKFRRIKEINTCRNDYIEYLIIENNDNVMPTLKHTVGVDYYIDGVPYDQKVSRSVGKEFKETYGSDYKLVAKENPLSVAECLYKGQDEERFDYKPRLLVVYLDDDVLPESIANIITEKLLKTPIKLKFEYNHKKIGIKSYETECFVILLHN